MTYRSKFRERHIVSIVKGLGIALLCVASVAVLLAGVVPAAILLLGLASGIGIDIHNPWARSEKILFFYSRPWVPLLVGMLLLALFGWGIWKLTRD